ncbi:MAG TPA: O-antigen ligase family protein [bacterium]|jgi:O-antigen ligase
MTLLRRLRVAQSKHLYFLLIAFLLPIYFIPTFRKGLSWFHVVNVVILAGYLFAFVRQGRVLRFYFLLPMLIYLMGSLLGMFASQAIGINLYTLGQDLYLYLWFVALCVIIESQDDIDYLATAWMFGCVMVLAIGVLRPSGLGIVREEFTFRNPNRAAAYFITTLGMLCAPALSGRRWFRFGLTVLILWAVWTTGSLASFISIAVGALMGLSAMLYLRRGGFWVVRQGGIMLLAAALVYTSVAFSDVQALLVRGVPQSFGRAPRSLATRQQIWQEGLETFRKHPLGIGPASFLQTVNIGLGSTRGSGALELHSDYIAALVERGVIGLAGFLFFQLLIVREVLRLIRLALQAGRRDLHLWAAGLAGVVAAYFTYSITHEALHHDTLWLLLAVIMAQSQILAVQVRAQISARAAAPSRQLAATQAGA